MRHALFALLSALLLTLAGMGLARIAHAQPATVTSEQEARVLALLKPARALAQQGRIAEAVTQAEKAREQASSQFGAAHWAVAYALDDLARYRKALGEFETAHDVGQQALSIAEKQFGTTARTAYFAESSSGLSYAAGRCDAAAQSAEKALDGYIASNGVSAADTRRAARALILLQIQRNRLDAGERTFSRVLATAGSATPDVGTLELRARLSLAAGHYADAAAALDRAELSQRRTSAGGDDSGPTLALLRAQWANETGDLARSEALISRLLADPDLPRVHRAEWLLALQQRARVQGYKGEYADALAGYRTALQEYTRAFAQSSPPLISVNHNLGWVYKGLGDYARAKLQLDQALASADACYGPVNSWSLNTLFERTRLLLELGRLNEAAVDAQRAVHDAEQLSGDNNTILRAYALSTRALARRRVGLLNEANEDLLLSVDLLRTQRGDSSWDLVPGYTDLADLALLRGEPDRAGEWARAALTIREKDAASSMWATGVPLAQLIDVAAARERWQDVDRYGSQLVEVVRHRLSASEARSDVVVGELRRSRELIERLLNGTARMPAAVLASKDRLPTVFAAAQLPHLTELTSALQLTMQNNATPATQALLAKRKTLLDELQTVQTWLRSASPEASGSTESTQRLLRRSAEIDAQLEQLDGGLRRQAPELAELLRPSLEEPDAIQALLAPTEALYVQVVTDTGTHGILLRPKWRGFRSAPLSRATVRRNVLRLRRALDLSLPIGQRQSFDVEASRQLYDGTLGLFAKELAGVTDLIVVLDDAFQNLPPGVLVTAPSKPGATEPPAYLVNQLGIVVEPSVSAFRVLRSRAHFRAGRSFIGFGNPKLAGAAGSGARSASASGPLSDLQSLPALPETEDELKRIAAALASDATAVHTGADFTKANVKRLDLSNYAVVSFATHGLLAGEFRGLRQPALVVSPPEHATSEDEGLLTASEIAGLKLRAQLVLLSACNTGRTDDGGGAMGLSALSRAFFFAGADSLLVSHWAVSSAATVALITESLHLMSADRTLSKAQALRRASLRLMQGAAGDTFRDPAYWAPFVLVGDPRPLELPSGRL